MNVRAISRCLLAAACLVVSFGPLHADKPADKGEKKERCPYAGTYTGTFTFMSQQGDQEGELNLTVDDNGNVTGDVINKTSNVQQTIKGTILKDNKAASVIEANNQKTTAFGTIARTEGGGITGTMTQRLGTTALGSFEFDVKPKAKKD